MKDNFSKDSLSYISNLEYYRKKGNIPLCNCMYLECAQKPIYSHVFQKKGVLSEISHNGKVMCFNYRDLFAIKRDELPICYKEMGINQTFGFYGFCSIHDNSIFAPIEPTDSTVDWYEEHNQYLLAYRTLCREYYTQLYTKSIFQNCLKTLILSTDLCIQHVQNIANCNKSIDVFDKYKVLFEKGIKANDYSLYKNKITELPFRLELCLASPITIMEDCKGLYFGSDDDKIVDTVNIVNIFPQKNSTVIIIGFLDGEKNTWATTIYQMLRSDDLEDICIALQDILFRSEFHCMSKKLYDEINSEIPKFLEEWHVLMNNYNISLPYQSNIFRNYIKRQLGYLDYD